MDVGWNLDLELDLIVNVDAKLRLRGGIGRFRAIFVGVLLLLAFLRSYRRRNSFVFQRRDAR